MYSTLLLKGLSFCFWTLLIVRFVLVFFYEYRTMRRSNHECNPMIIQNEEKELQFRSVRWDHMKFCSYEGALSFTHIWVFRF